MQDTHAKSTPIEKTSLFPSKSVPRKRTIVCTSHINFSYCLYTIFFPAAINK